MQVSIKQQNTFTIIAAANIEVIASYCMCMGVINIQTKVNSYRGVDK